MTLRDAADYIMKLPKAEQNLEPWQTAVEALIMAAEGRGPMMHSRIGVPRQRLGNDHLVRIDDLFTLRGIQHKCVSEDQVGIY